MNVQGLVIHFLWKDLHIYGCCSLVTYMTIQLNYLDNVVVVTVPYLCSITSLWGHRLTN